MARKKKEENDAVMEREPDEFSFGASEGFFDDTGANNEEFDFSAGMSQEFPKNIKTLNLPAQDAIYSYLLSREKDGEIIITNRESFPMKEGYILVCVEYELV